MKKKFYLNAFLLLSYLHNKNTRQFAFLIFAPVTQGIQNNHPLRSFKLPVHQYKQFV